MCDIYSLILVLYLALIILILPEVSYTLQRCSIEANTFGFLLFIDKGI